MSDRRSRRVIECRQLARQTLGLMPRDRQSGAALPAGEDRIDVQAERHMESPTPGARQVLCIKVLGGSIVVTLDPATFIVVSSRGDSEPKARRVT